MPPDFVNFIQPNLLILPSTGPSLTRHQITHKHHIKRLSTNKHVPPHLLCLPRRRRVDA